MTRTVSRIRVLGGAAVAAALLALIPASAQADTNGFSCRAETLNSSLFRQQPLNPLAAGSQGGLCADDNGGAPEAGPAILPGVLGLDGAYATTRVRPSAATAPAYQTVEARSGVADARIDASGNVLRVQAAQADSTASCVNGKVAYKSTGRVVGVSLFGQNIALNDGATTAIRGLDGLTQLLVHVRLNEETRDANGYTFRALHLTVPQDGSILDVSIGLNHLNSVGSPCTDFTGQPGGDDDGGDNGGTFPTLGHPFGGGDVVRLQDIPDYNRYKKISLCVRAKRYGRALAIIGNNKRNRITGSKRSDRIFAYGARDLLNGGSGQDCIEAGSGSDVVNGGTGHDALYGRAGRDYLDGGAGRDRISGGSGPDTIVTGSGRDRISGGSGNDKLFTRDGRDVVSGGAGNDRIFSAARGRRDRIKCGRGRDVARVDSYDRVSKDCEKVILVRGARRRR